MSQLTFRQHIALPHHPEGKRAIMAMCGRRMEMCSLLILPQVRLRSSMERVLSTRRPFLIARKPVAFWWHRRRRCFLLPHEEQANCW